MFTSVDEEAANGDSINIGYLNTFLPSLLVAHLKVYFELD